MRVRPAVAGELCQRLPGTTRCDSDITVPWSQLLLAGSHLHATTDVCFFVPAASVPYLRGHRCVGVGYHITSDNSPNKICRPFW